MQSATENLDAAGIAAEWMCFTHFPTETLAEAMETPHFIAKNRQNIASFTCGHFSLVHGAKAARRPADFGIADVWQAAGDDFIQTLFYRERPPCKSPEDDDRIEDFIRKLSRKYWLHSYPWAGSLSTAHSYLWYDRCGPDIFRRLSQNRFPPEAIARRDRAVERIAAISGGNEADIWQTLIFERREVSPAAYRRLAQTLPPVRNPLCR